MNWASMIVLIVLIAVVGQLLLSRQKRGPARQEDEEKRALKREVAELKQRIATLEKIATEKSTRLAREIDKLGAPDDRPPPS